ncbi:hypothetical protein [Actinomadura miaoliensis]|uniref:hypothetical protein n=1 Tax=Actinomadura miaoliensis TaxID=430685 RepID=UPI0031F16BC5
MLAPLTTLDGPQPTLPETRRMLEATLRALPIRRRVSGFNLDALLARYRSWTFRPGCVWSRQCLPSARIGDTPATARAERIRQATTGTEHEHDPLSSRWSSAADALCCLPASSILAMIAIAAKIRWMYMRHRQDRLVVSAPSSSSPRPPLAAETAP